MTNSPVKISYFSDVLCVWAYVAQIRLETLKDKFKDKIEITPFHVTLFGNTDTRIAEGWKEKGGYQGFGQHVLDVCANFPHVEINPNVWKTCQPKSSGNSHLFLKAIQLLSQTIDEDARPSSELELLKEIEWAVRLAFFRDVRDISDFEVLFEIADQFAVPKGLILKHLNDGSAMALFCSELAMRENYKLEGSPTYLLNDNRQKLFGNVGYKIMEANVAELLDDKSVEQASWC